jgi:hypothetical protein
VRMNSQPVRLRGWACILCLFLVSCAEQQPPREAETEVGPRPQANTTRSPDTFKFRSVLEDAGGKPLSGVVGVTFSIYDDPQGGAPLWTETQNVEANDEGHYSVALGATKDEGLPQELFGKQARWLGVRVLLPGESEQTRSLVIRGSQGTLRQAITIPRMQDAVGTPGEDGAPGRNAASNR